MIVLCFSFGFLVCKLVRAYRFRFPFFWNVVFHFRFAYTIVCKDGADWFTMPSNDDCLGNIAFTSLSNF